MPSPFPGMDPFIESQEWGDFHARAMNVASEFLAAQLPDGYAARVERRSYLEFEIEVESTGPDEQWMIPDVTVFESPVAVGPAAEPAGVAVARPRRCRLAKPVEQRETFLEIREARTRKVITAIELLSPTNKRAGSEGGRLYAEKQRAILETHTNFVEIDLLRGGQRVLHVVPSPKATYYALVSRADERPEVEVYAWNLRDPMPTIRIPLKSGDVDVLLDWQAVLNTAYDRIRYDGTIDYTAELLPPLSESDAKWVRPLLNSHLESRPRR